jgi:hypothetical protein
MKVQLRFLRQSEAIQAALQKDGWELVPQGEDSLIALHPLVTDEAAARNRLLDLGLLTSGSVYVEFLRRNDRRLNGSHKSP